MKKREENKRVSKNSKNKKKKNKIWKKVLLVLILILLVAGSCFAYKVYKNGWGLSGMLATVVGHDENTKKNLGEFKVLILGISTDQENAELTDTIMVASYNPNTQKATLLSIPRDTYTGKYTSKATAYEKMNALYSRKKDPQTTLDAVNKITGLDIKYYVIVKTEALIKLVDTIGGVTFNVPIDMNYDDKSQNLHIHFKKGEQLLDGQKAEELVRFRHNNNGTSYPEEYGNNDLGRMRTQREFIMQVLKQTLKPENIFKIGQIIDVAEENVITNIDFDAAKDYIPYAVEFNTDNLLTEVLPGTTPDWNTTNNVSIFVVDKKETAKLIQRLFYDRDIENNEEESTSTDNSISNTSSSSNKSNEQIKVEVLNGSGESKKLQSAVNRLQNAGFNVTRTGSTNTTAKTTIINKKDVGDSDLEKIKEAIEIGNITSSTSSSSKVEVTVIIGKDYK